MDVKETQPSTSETITVDSQLYLKPGSSVTLQLGHPKVKDLTDCESTGYCLWCWCGMCCALPTACCLGQKMGDKWSWVKYGIPEQLILNLDFH